MNEHKKSGYGKFGKGYYIALVLCAVAIGTAGYLYNRNAAKQTDAQADRATEVTFPALVEKESDVAVIATAPKGEIVLPSEAPTQPSQPQKVLKTAAPLAGDTLMDYSMEALSYNQTTRDWRVHNGVDIAAEEGTPVLAAADGQVTAIREDDAMGTTVVITHAGGYTTEYANLSEDLAVSAGQQVTLGQAIGTVGATALVETAMGPHLHFAVTYRDEPMDPAEFLSLGQ